MSTKEALEARVEAQQERIEELEDMMQALLNCYQEMRGRLSEVSTAAAPKGADKADKERPPSGFDNMDGDAEEGFGFDFSGGPETVEVPVYGLCFGYLNKLSSGVGRTWKKKWCILHDDGTLYYWKSVKASTDSSADKGVIPLDGYKVQDGGPDKTSFKLIGDGKRTYDFQSESVEDKIRWMDTINEEIARLAGGRHMSLRSVRALSLTDRPLPAGAPQTPQLLQNAAQHGYILIRNGKGGRWVRSYAVVDDADFNLYAAKGVDANSVKHNLKRCEGAPRLHQMDELYVLDIKLHKAGMAQIGFTSEEECARWATVLGSAINGRSESKS